MNEFISNGRDIAAQVWVEGKSFIAELFAANPLDTMIQQDNMPVIVIVGLITILISLKILKNIGLVIVLIAVMALSVGVVIN